MDVVDPKTRSRMMSGIRGKNTRPELLIRSGLHRKGFRFRLHVSDLAGKPDIVLPKYRAVVLANGCFWHGHEGCRFFKRPSTNAEFWRAKIKRNALNDRKALEALGADGWRVAVVWECALRKKSAEQLASLIDGLTEWLDSAEQIPAVEFTESGGPFPIAIR